jgi:glycosyltransferase EpsF
MAIPRILHMIGRMDRAGAETLIVTVLKVLDRTRYQFDFLVRSNEEGRYDRELKDLGCKVFRCPHRPNPLAYLTAAYQILRHQGPYCAVHSHLHFFDGVTLSIARVAGVPVRISHSHSTSDGCTESSVRRAYRLVMRSAIRLSATHHVGASKSAYEALFGKPYKSSAGNVIARNGVQLSLYEPSSNHLDLRDELHLPTQARLVGHVGRMIAPKNHTFLLEAFAELRKREPLAELVLVGDGPLKESIRAHALQINISEHVHFLGVRDDVHAVLPNLDCFVFPSQYEGLGLAVVEAQAAGVFCIASTAVPEEADVGCHLLQFLDLKHGPSMWAAGVAAALQPQSKPSWETRANCIRSAGYDIEDVAQTWMQFYSGSGMCVV